MKNSARVLRHSAILLLLLLLPCAAAAAQEAAAPVAEQGTALDLSAETLQELAAVVRGYFEDGLIVGGELLVIKDRLPVLHEAVGWRDREKEIPMERHSIFNIRSMTKPLTGAALQILVDEGKVRIDSPVAEYLPGFDNEKSRAITVEQLLSHRGGIPLTILKPGRGMRQYSDLVAMANAAGETGPEFEPGSKFWYSDSGTDAVGGIVQAVAGMPLDEFVRTRLLEPLGMQDSWYLRAGADPRWERTCSLYGGGGTNWVKFWSPKGEPFYPYAWGSQSLYCTPADYAKFLAMWMDGGAAGGRRLLSPAAVVRTLTPAAEMSMLGADLRFPTEFPGLEVFYGQMAVLHARPGPQGEPQVVIIGHSGSDGTVAWAWPEHDLMVLYFTQSRGQATVLQFEEHVDRLLFRGRERPEELVPGAWRPYLGTYVANFEQFRDTEFSVRMKRGRLALEIPGQLTFVLAEPDAEGRWNFADYPGLAVSFVRDAAGAVTALKLHKPDVTHELPKGKASGNKPEAAAKLTEEQVRPYLGFYLYEKDGSVVELVFHDGTLAAKLADIPEPLDFDPPDEEGFWVLRANRQVRIRFEVDAAGRAQAYAIWSADGPDARRVRVGPPEPD